MITNSVSNGAVIIRHREYLRDIFNSVNFENISFDLNPGITSSFPWLSQIAMSFAQYRFRGLVFEFKTTSSDTVLSSAASTSLGTVVLATQYNALDTPFTNKFEMENWEYSVSTKPSLSCMHPVECAKSQTPVSLLWTRNGPKSGDERLYDLGNFNIATVGMQGAAGSSAVGELWCSYEVEFYKPQFIEDVSTQTSYISNERFVQQGVDFPWTSGNVFGNVARTVYSNLPSDDADDSKISNWETSINTGTKTITIKDAIAKRFLINLTYGFSGEVTLTGASPAWLPITGGKYVRYLQAISGGKTTGSTSATAGQEVQTITLQTMIEATADVTSWSINPFTWTGPNITACTLIITEVGPGTCGQIA